MNGKDHILITGGAGFIGSNLAQRLVSMGERVMIYDSLARAGVETNLDRLRTMYPGRVKVTVGDIRDHDALAGVVKGSRAVFHLAAQVAVTTSLEAPEEDFEVNCRSTVRLLELLRREGRIVPLVFASTNKVYGDLADVDLELRDGAWKPADDGLATLGVDESRPLDFHTPYGCSKGAADQYVLDYARHLKVPACVFRMSCIYGPNQMGTEEQGWVAHFLRSALRGVEITLYGDGRQVRDVLHVSDVVSAYIAAWRAMPAVSGQAFNLGGGPDNAVSLIQILCQIELMTGRTIHLRHGQWRAGDQRWFVADARKARRTLGLGEPTPWQDGLADLAAWLERSEARADNRVRATA
ncbi:NAD-dependent epimerase/dehydratase family protein [Rhizorhapis suberifaciens]|uniref:CDP-paratose 2-epimerase n=1 Tax=Rhizorhapis suberifaciens TaxID=13656 RepID=A0A840HVB5_9SPHN|nr:NAD-dependent epimerase/dehydratase family protein [Rhizorhapis suberifaciens]MBB4641903.1 CDP-paratose 2-epimerase [Rhizorhapis suberifaciens]